jgi:hypothetical protein
VKLTRREFVIASAALALAPRVARAGLASDRWRALAVGKGLTKARVWVGDHGVWRSGEDWKKAPTFLADVAIEKTPEAHDHALSLFGSKYTREWSSWGPRFKNGLADGSRVLIRYRPAPA